PAVEDGQLAVVRDGAAQAEARARRGVVPEDVGGDRDVGAEVGAEAAAVVAQVVRPAAERLAAGDRQVLQRHGRGRADDGAGPDVEDAVVEVGRVDHGQGGTGADDGQVAGDVEVAGAGGILLRPGEGQGVRPGRQVDRVGPEQGVGLHDGRPQGG